jgi:peptidyl-prolyl cis-trans isomerase SurA
MIIVGEDEIDETLKRIQSRQGQTEYRLAEILLAVDGPEEENNVRRTAERISDQIRNGANFAAIARQFSQSPTAAVGGDLGWMHEAELGDDLKAIVPKLKRGTISQPVKTITGYRLLTLRDSRKIAVSNSKPINLDLHQIFLPFPQEATPLDKEAQIELAKTVRDTATNCGDFDLIAKEIRSSRPPNMGRFALKDLSPAIQAVVGNVPAGKISDPVNMPGGVLVLMVCGREGGEGEIKLPARETIADRLIQKKLSLMARRYLRDIRLSAVVDIRV